MSRSARAAAGGLGILLGLLFYAGAIGWLAQRLGSLPLVAEIAFYAFFGIAWIWPCRWLLRWIGRADKA
ncbi:MAG: DUF2842 domain-containing protein [Alphaproteobacteria bacterium]|nr:MAG: DUF2842 domain-containing protein [Alphaproteobacteria bacterium]